MMITGYKEVDTLQGNQKQWYSRASNRSAATIPMPKMVNRESGDQKLEIGVTWSELL